MFVIINFAFTTASIQSSSSCNSLKKFERYAFIPSLIILFIIIYSSLLVFHNIDTVTTNRDIKKLNKTTKISTYD